MTTAYNFRVPALADVALHDALPALVAAERQLRQAASAQGIAYLVAAFGGTRTDAITDEILRYRRNDYAVYMSRCGASGRAPVDIQRFRPIAAFGSSYHDFGAAFDVVLDSARTTLPAGVTWSAATARLGALAPAAGLRWGGTFPNPDAPHFELAISLAEARAAWDAHQRTRTGPGAGTDSMGATGQSTTPPGSTPRRTP